MTGARGGAGSEHLFVYGSLRSDIPPALLPAEARAAAGLLTGQTEQVGRGHVSGALYAIHWYPGLVEGVGDVTGPVVGEVWRLPPGSGLLAALDSYEGDAYARVRTMVTVDDGRQIEAWVYRHLATPPPVGGPVALIASGDYLQWLMTRSA